MGMPGRMTGRLACVSLLLLFNLNVGTVFRDGNKQLSLQSAWALSPGAWAFVASIDRIVEGLRRWRGLNMLRKRAVRRLDLC